MTLPADPETAVRAVIAKIDAAWRRQQFDGLEDCFHDDAVIAGPGYVEFARGRAKCAESYREFANNAAVLDYDESAHELRLWSTVAVYTFSWHMTYQREHGVNREFGTDQLVFELEDGSWRLVFRYIHFAPSESSESSQ